MNQWGDFRLEKKSDRHYSLCSIKSKQNKTPTTWNWLSKGYSLSLILKTCIYDYDMAIHNV